MRVLWAGSGLGSIVQWKAENDSNSILKNLKKLEKKISTRATWNETHYNRSDWQAAAEAGILGFFVASCRTVLVVIQESKTDNEKQTDFQIKKNWNSYNSFKKNTEHFFITVLQYTVYLKYRNSKPVKLQRPKCIPKVESTISQCFLCPPHSSHAKPSPGVPQHFQSSQLHCSNSTISSWELSFLPPSLVFPSHGAFSTVSSPP